MNKAKLKYVKYTKQELDQYVRDKNSCITLTNSEMHIGFPPWGFANFQETLTNIISREKVGKHDGKLNGIVLEVLNINVFGTAYPVHDDDPYNHIDLKANFYVFQPRIGAIIKGVVKHISHGHVAVIIYRVFNVSIRFNRSTVRDSLKINQQISFRVKMFDLQGAMPYIEGELIENKIQEKPCFKRDDAEDSGISAEETKKCTHVKFKNESDSSSEDSSDESNSDNNINEGLFPNVKIKEEKLSDSETKTHSEKTSKCSAMNNESDGSSESDESEDESSDEISTVNIKKEKDILGLSKPHPSIKQEKTLTKSNSSTGESSSDDEHTRAPLPLYKIKKEKSIGGSTTFIPRPIKPEPQPKIKQEPQSEDESVKRKKIKKSPANRKSLHAMESDLFDSFLR